MTRLIARKSLLVLGLLVSVFGFCAGAALAAAQPSATTHTASAHAATTRAAVGPILTTAYSSPSLINPSVTDGPVPAITGPAITGPDIEPTGICSVPGIGSIGSLFGFCASGSSSGGLLGGLNSICTPGLPQPEPANSGIDSIVRPPATSGAQGKTLYDNYGVAGQFWAPYGLQCSDMTSLIGNNVAGMVFDAAKAVDRVTITVYQSAAGNGILSWLVNVVNRLITSLGNAIYFPYLAPVVLLGVVWLAWNGLVRKRATRTIEGTVWMVIACTAAIWLISRPADFTGFGQSVSNGVTQVLNVAFSKLPSPGQTNCVPVGPADPQSPPVGNYGFVQGNGMVDQNANELWAVLVCKPWLDGEFGTTQYSTTKNGQTPVNTYGRQLLWAQAIAANENPTASVIQAKQDTYAGIAASIKQNDPAIYPLFQGDQWTSRLEIGFAALFAALIAGVLILLIAVTLIILKLGFLLLLIAGPFFLIVGTHPGFGRVVAIRWVEMIIGVLLKQVAVAIVLSVLLYAYSLIMGTSDSALPWALKILMIALVTIAVFIYRKPFQHLFSAVGYSSSERREQEVRRSREFFRTSTLGAAAAASGFAGSRLGRWSRRDTGDSAALADHIAAVGAGGVADPELAVGKVGAANGHADASQRGDDADGKLAGVRGAAGGNGRAWAAAEGDGLARTAPALHLPSRTEATSGAPSGWARGAPEGTGTARPPSRAGDAPPRTITPTGATIGAGGARAALPPGTSAGAPAGTPAGTQRQAPPLARQAPPARQVPPSRPASAAPPPSRSAQAPPGSAQRPAPQWTSSRQEPPPRAGAGGTRSAPSSSGAPRSRWQDEGTARQAPEARGGRPLWRPGPIRSSGGSGSGSGPAAAPPPPARPAPPARQAPPAPQRQAPPARQAPPPPQRQAPPSPSPYSGGPPRPSRPSGGGPAPSAQSHTGQYSAGQYSAGQYSAGQYSAGQYSAGRHQSGASQSGSAGSGGGSAAGSGGGQPGAQGGEGRPAAPTPFWLRPVRRKK